MNHSNNLIVLLLFLLISFVISSKVSPRLDQIISSSKRLREEEIKIWIYFTDKDNNNNEKRNNIIELHPNTLKRRQKMEKEVQFDNNDHDIPVSTNYIQQVKEAARGIKIRRSSKWLNAVSVSLSDSSSPISKVVRRVSELPFVSYIDVVASYQRQELVEEEQIENEQREVLQKRDTMAISYGDSYGQLALIKVPEAHMQGLNGTGVVVLILDSGFDKSHPSIRPLDIIDEYDFVDDDNNTQSIPPDEQNSHGTACLSNLGGWAPDTLIGSGFGARFVLAKTENTKSETRTEEDDFISAIEWGEGLGVDLVSSSLGYTDWYSFVDRNGTASPVSRVCDMASRLGITIVVAAGNLGAKGISTPADGTEVIAVGAVTPAGLVADFSSLGPSSDGRIKPDISAQGDAVLAANVPISNISVNPYSRKRGTSFSCPLVAGAVAILLQAHPDWTPAMVKEALQMTATNSTSPNIIYGWGIIDIMSALKYMPKGGDCRKDGCGSNGCCVDAVCQCAPGFYGRFCNFKRVECVTFCNVRSYGQGECLRLPTGESYRCAAVDGNTIDLTPLPICPECRKDDCGVCFGFNNTCCDTQVDSCGVCGGNSTNCHSVQPTHLPTSSPTTTSTYTTHSYSSSSFSISPSFSFFVIICFSLFFFI